MTVTVAAWTDEEARVRAALASCCSWREMGGVGQVVLEVCWAEPGQVGTKPPTISPPDSACLPKLSRDFEDEDIVFEIKRSV